MGRWAKAGLIGAAVVAILMGALAIFSSLTQNSDCASYQGCIPDDEASAILFVGIAVAALLFAAAGIAIAACRKASRRGRELHLGLVLGVLGGAGWFVWLVMSFTAGIRATT
ncbi:MAG: hypothetical protein M3Y23_05775 [Actinomycetota bacterium]|nr:hypothetical protein [Actinomycetota bacterium]